MVTHRTDKALGKARLTLSGLVINEKDWTKQDQRSHRLPHPTAATHCTEKALGKARLTLSGLVLKENVVSKDWTKQDKRSSRLPLSPTALTHRTDK